MAMHGLRLLLIFSVAIALLPGAPDGARAGAPPLRIAKCRVQFADSLTLASQQTGVVAQVLPPGSMVRPGGDVARLRDGVLQAKRAIAAKEAANDIEVRFARKSAQLASLKHQRAEKANSDQAGTVSELELREMQLAAEKAALQQEQAEHTLAIAGLRLAEIDAQLRELRMPAPAAMFVRAVHRRAGEVVRQGDVIAEVVDISRVRVEGHAPLATARWMQVGKRVEIELEGHSGGQRFAGTITFIDVKIEPVSQHIRFTVEVPNPTGQLREGMQAAVLISQQVPNNKAPQTAGRRNTGPR